MHRTRLYAVIIDAPRQEASRAADFWAAVLGSTPRPVPAEPQFTDLPEAVPGLTVAVQAVDDTARYHLDIETDDVDAETERLLALGATEVDRWLECRILRAPGGHLLCVVPVHSDPEFFAAHARTITP
ncbi:VOC family protein [Streptosporangium sp. NPDC050855]|uniref:VOC family protein n=1 Tax=Streptosporangium sp. NPDC050855 TaxID=3366194 RepID=UPI0037B27327